MNIKIIILLISLFTVALPPAFFRTKSQQKDKIQEKNKTTKEIKDKSKVVVISTNDSIKNKSFTGLKVADTLKVEGKFKFYKKNAHASYYAQKFQGRRTASGKPFDNNKYTAAHKKLPFGTIARVTNETNGKSVIVEITDRGPFTKAREIDLTKKAFMELVDNKKSGSVIVKIEVIEDKNTTK